MIKRLFYMQLFKRNLITRTFINSFRNFSTNKIRKSKKLYYETAFDQVRNDTRKSWKIIDNIFQSKYPESIVKEIIFNSTTYDNQADIATIFDNYFHQLAITLLIQSNLMYLLTMLIIQHSKFLDLQLHFSFLLLNKYSRINM